MANPSNAIGTNGAFGGRTSVNALNDVLATFTGAGVISGWAVAPSSGMTVQVGGQSGLRDVAIAEDNNGNRTTVDNISQAPVPVDIASAPSTNSRMDAIVGYVENPPQGSATVLDNPAACGIVAVSGTASSSPSAPTDSAIRTALTGLGINGATAYYAILGYVTVPSGTTDIDATMISAVPYTNLNTANNIANGSISADKVDFTTTPFVRIVLVDGTTIPTGSYAQLKIDSEFNNNFCHINGTQVVFDKIGTFIGTITVGRSTRPGSNTRINGGLRRNGTNNNLIPLNSPILSGDSPFVHGAGLFNIQSGDYGQVFLSSESLGNCDTLAVSISPLL